MSGMLESEQKSNHYHVNITQNKKLTKKLRGENYDEYWSVYAQKYVGSAISVPVYK